MIRKNKLFEDAMKADLNDINFMQGMHDLFDFDDKEIEEILDILDADSLINLSDAISKQDKEVAEKIINSFENDLNHLFRGKEFENKSSDKKEDKKKPVKPPKNYEFSIGDDVAIKTTNEEDENGKDKFITATVYKPKAPGNTIGVKIDGQTKMIDRDKVYILKESGVIGMVNMPELHRMQQLAGIQVEMTPREEIVQEPVQSMDGDYDCVSAAINALDELEKVLPEIRLGDLKIIRQRIIGIQTKMNESLNKFGRARKL